MILLNLLSLTENVSTFTGTLSPEVLNERINSEYFNVKSEGKYKFSIKKQFDYFEFTGNIEFDFEQMCGRCVEFKPRSLTIPISGVVKFKQSDDMEDDVGIYYTESEVFDLEELLVEQIILNLDPFWLPELEDDKCEMCDQTICLDKGKNSVGNLFESNTLENLKKTFAKRGF